LSARAFSFGEFRLLPEERTLLAAGRPVRISSRALDILAVLVDHPGELLSKSQLLARAWPNTKVEENNLRVHIGALRKVLGESATGVSYIATVPGRGYSFVGHVEQESVRPLLATIPPALTLRPLPAPLSRMIGRTATLETLLSRMREQRLVTIVGPGGIGKTTVALAMADRLRGAFEHQAGFADLSPLADPQLLPSALASALGVPTRSDCPLEGLIAFLREKRLLIVLDSCEHVIEAAATMTEALLKGASGVRVLATSREQLGVEGEWVEHLEPLGTPDSGIGLTSAQALAFPALQLFAERATASLEGFKLSDEDVRAAVEICRKLDGIPLAIELAAARVGVFGISGLAARLNDRLEVLTRGRRTAPPRHKTLRATLDWSYCILSEHEQQVLKRLAIFSGEFTLDAATDVVAFSDIPASEVPEIVANLAAKSLLIGVLSDGIVCYRLLDTTRAYAREKLLQSPDFHAVSRRHAENCCKNLSVLRAASASTAVSHELMSNYRRTVDDVRAALRWSFSPDGDQGLGVTLTAAAAFVFMRLSLLDECREYVERALRASAAIPTVEPLTQKNLNLALGHLLLHMAKPAEMTAAFDRALRIAEQIGVPSHRAQALAGAWLGTTCCADHLGSLKFAKRFRTHDSSKVADLAYCRMMAVPLHYLGQFADARRFIDQALEHPLGSARAAHDALFYADLEVVIHAILARNSWMQGFPDQASHAALRSLERAVSLSNAVGVVYALVIGACPVALWRGDLNEARRLVSSLSEYVTQFPLEAWRTWAPYFELVMAGTRTLDVANFDMHQLDTISTLREGSIPAEALTRIESGRVGWNAAEILRVHGEQILKDRGPEGAKSAEEAYLRSLEIARRQGALSWQLRTATSLARLWRDQHRPREARELLADVHGRFTEGFQTLDHARAGALLQELSAPG
jgi:predicted ATPase/DNA-binding winged helix-turn-helix (wHTH) protein